MHHPRSLDMTLLALLAAAGLAACSSAAVSPSDGAAIDQRSGSDAVAVEPPCAVIPVGSACDLTGTWVVDYTTPQSTCPAGHSTTPSSEAVSLSASGGTLCIAGSAYVSLHLDADGCGVTAATAGSSWGNASETYQDHWELTLKQQGSSATGQSTYVLRGGSNCDQVWPATVGRGGADGGAADAASD